MHRSGKFRQNRSIYCGDIIAYFPSCDRDYAYLPKGQFVIQMLNQMANQCTRFGVSCSSHSGDISGGGTEDSLLIKIMKLRSVSMALTFKKNHIIIICIVIIDDQLKCTIQLEMRGKAQLIARSAPQCRPLASSSETKPFCHLANVQRMHVASVCLHYGNIIWLPW